ncbi:MAG: hypothetical protein NTX61_17750 [Bacteroidetes bacterium]|nr:hypothetical protein [Bacteroidota bacterium]
MIKRLPYYIIMSRAFSLEEEFCGLSEHSRRNKKILPKSDLTIENSPGSTKSAEMVQDHFAGQYTADRKSGDQ